MCCIIKVSIFLPSLATGIHLNTLPWLTKTYCEAMTTTFLQSKLLYTFSIDYSWKFDINNIAKALLMITEAMKSIANEILMMIINGTLINNTLTALQISDLWSKALDNHTLIQYLDAYWHPLMVKLQHFSYAYFDNIYALFDFHVLFQIFEHTPSQSYP
eukprot:465894_1